MILDANCEFCDAVSVIGTAGATTLIGSQIDTNVIRDVGAGKPVYLVITVDTAIATGGTAGSISFKLASDDSASISTTTSTIHIRTPEYVTDDSPVIPAGSVLLCQALPSGLYGDNDYERYLGILMTVTTANTTAGKINAFLTLDPTGWVAYADAVN